MYCAYIYSFYIKKRVRFFSTLKKQIALLEYMEISLHVQPMVFICALSLLDFGIKPHVVLHLGIKHVIGHTFKGLEMRYEMAEML